MTKQEYLASLERLMGGLDAQERQSQLDYYSEMFDDMLEDGLTEDEAAARLETARREAGETEPVRLPEEETAEGKRTNKRRWGRILIWILVVVVLVPVVMILSKVIRGMMRSALNVGDAVETVITGVRDDREWDGMNWSDVWSEDGFYTVDPAATAVNQLAISWTSGQVELVVWDQDYIGFGEGPQKQERSLRWRVDDGVLYIQDYRTMQLDLGPLEPKNLRVQLPESVATELTGLSFDGVSADLTAEGIHPNFLTAETISGDVELTAMECVGVSIGTGSGAAVFSGGAEQIEAHTTSGGIEIECDGMRTADHVTLGSVSGTIHVSGKIGSSLTVESTSGNVSVDVSEFGAAPQAMEVVTVSGEVDIALDEYVPIDVDYSTVSGNFKCTQPKYFRNGEEFSGGEYVRSHTGQGYVGEPLPITVSTTSGDLTITGK